MKVEKGAHLVVNAYSEGWLRKGFPWVYPKEVLRGSRKPGTFAELRSEKGERLGTALLDDGWLAARVIRHGDGPIDRAYLWEILDRAAALRDVVVDAGTTGFRLLHGENDGLPGVRIDWWAPFAVVILDSPAQCPLLPEVAAWLIEVRGARGVYLCYRPDPRETREMTGAAEPGLLAGHRAPGAVRVTERGIAFRVLPEDGPDVGLYADMREVRAWLEPTWGGVSVLNTFCFTGAFSVSAARYGASEVVSVDLSAKTLDRLEENLVANELPTDVHELLAEDSFKALDRFRRQGRTFDRVILDPPPFSHSAAGNFSLRNDYPRLVAAACRVLSPGGWLIAANNLGDVAPREFRGQIAAGLKKAELTAQEIYFGGQGADFPAATWFPESRHLKVGVWRLWG